MLDKINKLQITNCRFQSWLILFSLIILYPCLQNGWVNWDDPQYVTQNTSIRDFSFSGILNLFHPKNRVLDTYTPLTLIHFSIDYALVQDNPFWYHLTSLFLHLINVVLVFRLIYLMTKQKYLAFFVAILFGIHPMHVESVAWVTERKDVLFSVFFLLACIQYLNYLRTSSQYSFFSTYYCLAFISAILAILAKPQAVILPIILLLLVYWEKQKISKRDLLIVVPFFLVSLITGITTLFIMDTNPENYGWLDRILISGHAAWIYAYKSIFPLNQLHDMGRPEPNEIPVYYYLTTFLSAVLPSVILWLGRKQRVIIFGISFYFFTLILSLHLLKINSGIAYERFTYLPYIGLFFIIGFVLQELQKKWSVSSNTSVGILIAIFCIYGYLANQRCRVWKNDETLWSDVIEKNPQHLQAWCKRSTYYASVGKLDLALSNQNECIRLNPNNGDAWSNRGSIYKKLEQPKKALSDYKKAIEVAPKEGLGYLNRGILLMEFGNSSEGINDLQYAVKLNPNISTFWLNLGLGYEYINEYNLAIENYSKAIEIDANDYLSWKYRGNLHLFMNDFEEAVIDLSKAISLNPNDAEIWYKRSKAHFGLKNILMALSDYKKALENNLPNNHNYYQKLLELQ